MAGGVVVAGGAVALVAGEEDPGRVGLAGAVLIVGAGAELGRVRAGLGVEVGDFRSEGEGVTVGAWRACDVPAGTGAGSAELGPTCR